MFINFQFKLTDQTLQQNPNTLNNKKVLRQCLALSWPNIMIDSGTFIDFQGWQTSWIYTISDIPVYFPRETNAKIYIPVYYPRETNAKI